MATEFSQPEASGLRFVCECPTVTLQPPVFPGVGNAGVCPGPELAEIYGLIRYSTVSPAGLESTCSPG